MGPPRPRRHVTLGDGWCLRATTQGLSHSVVGDHVTIGRHHANDLQLGSLSSSNWHAELGVDGAGLWCVTDRQSSNGTLLNGRRLEPDRPVVVSVGDRLKFTKKFDSAPEFVVELVGGDGDLVQTQVDDDDGALVQTQADDDDEHPDAGRKRPRRSLALVDDYRCAVCGDLPLPADPCTTAAVDLVHVVPCRHHFHRGCIEAWVDETRRRARPATCPSCRASIDRIDPLGLIHQHAALLHQERSRERAASSPEAAPEAASDSVLLDALRLATGTLSRSLLAPMHAPDPTSAVAAFASAIQSILARVARYTTASSTSSSLFDLLVEAFVVVCDGVDGFGDEAPGVVREHIDRLLEVWLSAALAADAPNIAVDARSFPKAISDTLKASMRPWSDPALKACLSSGVSTLREPQRVARQRVQILVDQGRLSDAGNYGESQSMRYDACLCWIRCDRIDRLVNQIVADRDATLLSWAQRVALLSQIQGQSRPGHDKRQYRFSSAIFDAPCSSFSSITTEDTPDVVTLLVEYVRSSSSSDLKQTIASVGRFLDNVHPVNIELLHSFLLQVSNANPTASAFLAIPVVVIVSKDSSREPVESLLRLVVVLMATHGDTQRRDCLSNLLASMSLPPSIMLSLVQSAIIVGCRGHILAWQLLLQVDLDDVDAAGIVAASKAAERLHTAGVAIPALHHDFFLRLFKQNPSRATFQHLVEHDDALSWLRDRPASSHTIESMALLVDFADTQNKIFNLITVVVDDPSFSLGHDAVCLSHLLGNRNVQKWLLETPTAPGTQLIERFGTVLEAAAPSSSSLLKVVDDLPPALGARIYEDACRSAVARYSSSSRASSSSRVQRSTIRSWIQRLRSLCLVAGLKARWTGFQTTSLRALKPSDALHRDLRAAGIFNTIV